MYIGGDKSFTGTCDGIVTLPLHTSNSSQCAQVLELHEFYADFRQFWLKNRVSSRPLVKIQVSQICLDPIQNCVSARSVHLEVAYLEALLYLL